VLAAAAWSAAAQVTFDSGTVLDYSDGLLTLAVGTVGAWMLAAVLDRRERQRLRLLFAANSPEVVEHVLREPLGRDGVLTASTVIAGYRIEEEVGHGGMGVVYRASQLRLERPVALKLIRSEYAQSPRYRARFERESRLAAAVAHPHVIPVLDAGEDAGLLYIAMQFIDGINLFQMVDGVGVLEPADAARLLEQIGGALDAAHGQRLVHRDVKPANIVVRVDDPRHAFLTDFGLAGQLDVTSSHVDGPAGTIDYLSPEQIEGRTVDHRADVYALAAVLYFCLTGTAPFPREAAGATLWAHLNSARPAASALRPELPASIDRVIGRGMAITPADRHASAGALAVDACVALGLPVSPTGSLDRANNRRRSPGVSEDRPTHLSE